MKRAPGVAIEARNFGDLLSALLYLAGDGKLVITLTFLQETLTLNRIAPGVIILKEQHLGLPELHQLPHRHPFVWILSYTSLNHTLLALGYPEWIVPLSRPFHDIGPHVIATTIIIIIVVEIDLCKVPLSVIVASNEPLASGARVNELAPHCSQSMTARFRSSRRRELLSLMSIWNERAWEWACRMAATNWKHHFAF